MKLLGRHHPVSDAIALFEKALEYGSGLDAIVVTESGTEKQRPLGIMTTWDLPNLYRRIA